MKISSVEAFLLSYPFSEPLRLPYYGGERKVLKRDAMMIRVRTEEGLTGYAPGQASERAKKTVGEKVAPFLTGRKLADPDALRVQFLAECGPTQADVNAYCSVEIALWDLVAKSHGLPLSEYLGGRVRDRIRLYGSAGMYMDPEGYAREAEAVAELGFRAYKMRPALGPEEDLRTMRLMREAVGPSLDLMVDAHTWWRMGDKSYDEQTVADLASEMAEYDIAWLEEPLPPHDHEAYARLKEFGYVPIASGEHEPNEEAYLDLILAEAVDYVQMDIVCQGGFPTARRLMPEIAKSGLKFAFHSWGTALEVLAAAHLGICWPETVVEWLEYPCYSSPVSAGMYPFPLASDILKEPLTLDSGDLIVPRGPGLGIEINEDVIQRYPWIPGPWSTFKMTSPEQTWAVTGDHSVRWDEGK